MRIFLSILLLFVAGYSWGQHDSIPPVQKEMDIIHELSQPDPENGAVVYVTGDPRIEQLLKMNRTNNKKGYSYQGYRIQILSTSSYNSNIDSLKKYTENFEKLFPGIPAYLQYFDPDFKIRVGNFHSRLETIPTLKRIRKKYPNSYPVKTEIFLKELNRVQAQDTVTEATTPVFPFRQ